MRRGVAFDQTHAAQVHAAECRVALAAGQPRPPLPRALRNLARVNLRGAYLRGADLRGADLSGADLRGACLDEADLTGAIGVNDVPRRPVHGLAAAVLQQIEQHPETHDQTVWHSQCGTRHCVAGWAVAPIGGLDG